jgi:hypothetical protein
MALMYCFCNISQAEIGQMLGGIDYNVIQNKLVQIFNLDISLCWGDFGINCTFTRF